MTVPDPRTEAFTLAWETYANDPDTVEGEYVAFAAGWLARERQPITGVCSGCGRELVRIPGEVTYHPAESFPPGSTCPLLLQLEGTESLSFRVPYTAFLFTSS